MTTQSSTAPQALTTLTESPRVIFLGTPAIAVPILEALSQGPFKPALVITEPDKPAGRGHKLQPPPVKVAAQSLGIPVAQPATGEELFAAVSAAQPTIGVVVAYGQILKPTLLELPAHGFVNLHFSLLPKYRGATPIQTALLNGDQVTGVTAMQIDEGLDTGPILTTATAPIEPTDTAATLSERLAAVAAGVVNTVVAGVCSGMITKTPQPSSDEPVTKRLTKADGEIDWSQPADSIERFIRAMNPWPSAWTIQAGVRYIMHGAHLANGQLVIDAIQAAGRSVISGKEFARGYPAALTALVATGKVAPHD